MAYMYVQAVRHGRLAMVMGGSDVSDWKAGVGPGGYYHVVEQLLLNGPVSVC